MIADSDAALAGTVVDCEICIIGGGAAGITIAREFLGRRSLRLVLLESGGLELDVPDQYLYAGVSVGLPYFDLMSTRLRYFGGSTNHWAGLCGPLQPIDFERQPWMAHSGWPIKWNEYARYLPRAETVCEVDDAADTLEQLDELTGGTELDITSPRFVRMIKQYSPPTRFGKRYRSELERADNVRVILKSNVVDIEAVESGNAIRTVRVRGLAGTEFRVRARAFVLATGGLENPRLLLLSNGVQKNGLGNDRDLVGRYFMEHPHLSLGRLVLAKPGIKMGPYIGGNWRRMPGVRASLHMAPTESLLRERQLPNFDVTPQIEPLDESAEVSLVHDLGLRLRWREFIDRRQFFKFFADEPRVSEVLLTASLEQVPNPASRILLGDAVDALGQRQIVLDWRFTAVDEAAPLRIAELLGRELGAHGIGRLQIRIETGGHNDHVGGHHHMGTTRMSSTPADGVVDTDCRVHGVRNLYVAGSSVFPTGGAINPTLSIVALALRLSDHLKETVRP